MAPAKTAREPKPKGPPVWTREDLIVLEGGPYDGHWFLSADWDRRVRATTRMQEVTPGRPSPTLRYQPTGRTASHPIHSVPATVWKHQ